MTFGGREGFQFGPGTGLEFTHYRLALGIAQLGGIGIEARGIAFALDQGVTF